jgi:1,4-alpha-glucan branching enzyme
MAHDQRNVRLINAIDYLKTYPTNQVVTSSMSSWGYQGYSETWLMGRNHWIYPPLYEMINRLDILVRSNPEPDSSVRKALDQFLRELLLAQSSDWAFMLHQEKTQTYAEKRVNCHITNMMNIHEEITRGKINCEFVDSIRDRNNIFSDIDLFETYRGILSNWS